MTLTDSIGYYEFDDIMLIENWQIHLYHPQDSIKASDELPDGDIDEEIVGTFINVSVEEDEHDKGNNFDVLIQSYTALSGQVLFEDPDVTGAEHAGLTLELYSADANGIANLDNLLMRTQTNEAGYYEFDWLESGYYAVVFPYQYYGIFPNQVDYEVVQSGDTSPDDDPVGNDITSIPVYLDWYEIDSNNNFTIVKNSTNSVISGHVIADINGDGQGDIGIEGEKLELYERGADGLPTSALVDFTKTNAEGYYQFLTIDLAEYVIKYVGSGDYTCLESLDTSPESAEPIGNDCQYLHTDVLTVNAQDGDNLFIVE